MEHCPESSQRATPPSRRELRQARREFERKLRRAQRDVAGHTFEAAGPDLRAGLERLKNFLEQEHPAIREIIRGIDDPALLVVVPDAFDREALLAGARVAKLTGDRVEARRLRQCAAEWANLKPARRLDLLADLRWHPRTLSMLIDPPRGSIPVAYSGSEIGHGSLLLFGAAALSRGGSA